MEVSIPEFSLIMLIGVTGSGKSTLARRHFSPTQVVSSDHCRALVADDENNQSATGDAFELLHFLVAKRLKRGRLTVVDATNVQPASRQSLVELAQQHACTLVALVLDMPEDVLNQRRKQRTDRNFGDYVLHRQRRDLWQSSVQYLQYEGFQKVFRLSSPEDVDNLVISIQTSA